MITRLKMRPLKKVSGGLMPAEAGIQARRITWIPLPAFAGTGFAAMTKEAFFNAFTIKRLKAKVRKLFYGVILTLIFNLFPLNFVSHAASGSSNFLLEMPAFPNGGGAASSAETRMAFSVIGGGFASITVSGSSSFLLSAGQASYFSLGPAAELMRWLISDLIARTDVLGSIIPAASWQRDTDPYFSWRLRVEPAPLLNGFSIGMDTAPDAVIDTRDTSYQYPDGALPSGKHVFSVMPISLGGLGESGSVLSFEVWVDVTPPYVNGLVPQPGSVWGQGKTLVSALATDGDSGLDPGMTMMSLNGNTLNYSYNEADGTLSVPDAECSEGNNMVLVKAYDKVGNSVSKAWNFLVDTYPPQGALLINNGADISHSAYVSLNLQAQDAVTGVEAVFISNDGVFDTEYNHPYAYASVIKDWLLASPDVDGVKAVFVKFKDGAGNISATSSGQILLSRMTPDTRIISGPAAVTVETSAEFRFEATKEGCVFRYSSDNRKWSDWSAGQQVALHDLKGGNNYFYVKSGFDLNDDGEVSLDEEDPTPAQWVWTIGAGAPGQNEKILYWRR